MSFESVNTMVGEFIRVCFMKILYFHISVKVSFLIPKRCICKGLLTERVSVSVGMKILYFHLKVKYRF